MDAVPLALYVHLPWCRIKCPYCDFYSRATRGQLPEQAYVKALLADAQAQLADCQRAPISIFIGGGTPSLFSVASLDRLLRGLDSYKPFAAAAEITVEANPESLAADYLRDLRAIGVNRLSIGVQSFDDARLRLLGRAHDSAMAKRALQAARSAGFQRINVDLMYGLPGQLPQQAVADLQEALRAEPGHISWYRLTIEPNTEFHRRPPPLPDAPTIERIERQGRRCLAAAGYRRYEISSYGASHRCQHNLNYWQYGDYIGLGAGAHGKQRQGEHIYRRWHHRDIERYLQQPTQTARCERLNRGQRRMELLMNVWRLRDGLSRQLLPRALLSQADLEPALSQACRDRLLWHRDQRWGTTARGSRLLDSLLLRFAAPVGEVSEA